MGIWMKKGLSCSNEVHRTGAFLSHGAFLGFKACRKYVGVGIVVIFVSEPVFIMDGTDECGGCYGQTVGISIRYFVSQVGDKAPPVVILGHKVKNGKGKLAV